MPPRSLAAPLLLLVPLAALAASGTLAYATYVGGSGADQATALAVDGLAT